MGKQFKLDKVNALLSGAEQQLREREQAENLSETEKITILREFQTLIPPLTDEEYFLLEHSIMLEGCRDPLVVWPHEGKLILIDGHNRHLICKTHHLSFQIVKRNFDTLNEARDWIIINQLAKRNITEETKSYLRGIQYKREKLKKGGTGANQYSVKGDQAGLPNTAGRVLVNTAEKIADMHQVSDRTIRNDERFADAIEIIEEVSGPDAKTKFLSRQFKAGRSEIIDLVKRPPEDVRRIVTQLEAGIANDLNHAIALVKGYKETEKKPIPNNKQAKTESLEKGVKDKPNANSETKSKLVPFALSAKALATIEAWPAERKGAIDALNNFSVLVNKAIIDNSPTTDPIWNHLAEASAQLLSNLKKQGK